MSVTTEQAQLAQKLLAASNHDIKMALAALKQARLPQSAAPASPRSDTPLITIEHLCKSYKVGSSRVEALKDVSLTVYKGEFIAITGTSGSGKSTLLQLMGGLDKPQSGSVTVARQHAPQSNPRHARR